VAQRAKPCEVEDFCHQTSLERSAAPLRAARASRGHPQRPRTIHEVAVSLQISDELRDSDDLNGLSPFKPAFSQS
jgi:hypothetical protein